MKKYIYGLAIIVSLSMIIMLPVNVCAQEDFVLYDDFSSGNIDPELWDIDNTSAAITVENGEAKFVHDTWIPGDSSWLIFKNPQCIMAAKVSVRFEDKCDGVVRARLGCDLGWFTENLWIWQQIQIINQSSQYNKKAQFQLIESWTGPYDIYAPYEDRGEWFYSNFQYPLEVVNKTFVIGAYFDYFDTGINTFFVDGLGESTFKPPHTIQPHAVENYWVSIGTRNNWKAKNKNERYCTVYFDNVWVIWEEGCVPE